MINLGDEVKEKVTGFLGIAVARISWISGCDMIRIQPKARKDGTIDEARDFDEPLMDIIKKAKVKVKKGDKEVGGSPSFHATKSRF